MSLWGAGENRSPCVPLRRYRVLDAQFKRPIAVKQETGASLASIGSASAAPYLRPICGLSASAGTAAALCLAARLRSLGSRMRLRSRIAVGVASSNSSGAMYSIARSFETETQRGTQLNAFAIAAQTMVGEVLVLGRIHRQIIGSPILPR
jgi:hypothetical protein